MTDATELDEAAIRARLEAATPGPWRASGLGTWVGFDDKAGFFRMFERSTWATDADAEFIAHARTDVGLLLAALDEARAEVAEIAATALTIDRERMAAESALADSVAAHRIASDAADRFRDIVSECLGLDENPGDDELVPQIRAHFGNTGPEPTRWRDFMVGAEAMRDQILADRAALATPTTTEEPS